VDTREQKRSNACFSSSLSHRMCRTIKKWGKRGGKDIFTRIERIPGKKRGN